MKKPSGIRSLPSAVVSFTGDCARQNALNRTADRLAHHPATRPAAPRPLSKNGERVISVLFFVCLIGCAYGVMAL